MSRRAASASERLQTEGLALRLVPYRDSDLVVTFFTATHGKLGALARGGRKSQRRFGGALQPFVRADLEMQLRPGADLAELSGAVPVQSYAGLAREPRQLGRAGYLCELVEVLTRERDPLPGVLELLSEALERLADSSDNPAAVLRAFEVRLLSTLGFWPDHGHCADCGAQLEDEARSCEGHEGLLCRDCGEEPLPAALIGWLQPGSLDPAARPPLDRALGLAVGRRTQATIRALTTRPLRSVAYLRQLGAAEDGEVG